MDLIRPNVRCFMNVQCFMKKNNKTFFQHTMGLFVTQKSLENDLHGYQLTHTTALLQVQRNTFLETCSSFLYPKKHQIQCSVALWLNYQADETIENNNFIWSHTCTPFCPESRIIALSASSAVQSRVLWFEAEFLLWTLCSLVSKERKICSGKSSRTDFCPLLSLAGSLRQNSK